MDRAIYMLYSKSTTTSIRQFSILYFNLVALEKSTFYQNFYIHNSGCCCMAAVQSRPDFILMLLYFSCPSGTFSIEKWIPLKPVLGAWEMLHLLSLINRLNKNDSAIFISLLCFGCSLGIDFLVLDFYQHCGVMIWWKDKRLTLCGSR